MPGIFSLTGADTLVLAGSPIINVADGDWFVGTFENDLASVKTGKNQNVIFASNAMGQQMTAMLRLIRASDDDLFLNSLLQQQLADFASFETLDGQAVKRVGDGTGFVSNDGYVLEGGVFTRNVDLKSNAEGDTEQSVSVYRMTFALAQRIPS